MPIPAGTPLGAAGAAAAGAGAGTGLPAVRPRRRPPAACGIRRGRRIRRPAGNGWRSGGGARRFGATRGSDGKIESALFKQVPDQGAMDLVRIAGRSGAGGRSENQVVLLQKINQGVDPLADDLPAPAVKPDHLPQGKSAAMKPADHHEPQNLSFLKLRRRFFHDGRSSASSVVRCREATLLSAFRDPREKSSWTQPSSRRKPVSMDLDLHNLSGSRFSPG